MSNRRQFLKDAATAAGVVFTSCGLLDRRMQAQAKRRQVSVGGKRIRTIDVHAHCVISEAQKMMGKPIDPGAENLKGSENVVAESRFKTMDEWGVDMQALSINASWYDLDRDLMTKVIPLQNEKLAELCAKYKDRFVAFASVSLQFPELAAQQLEDAVKKLGLRGAAIGGHVNGDECSNAKLDPFWRKAEELGCVVFVHPQGIPELGKRLSGNGGLTNVIGNPLETTIFLEHMIYDGKLDQFPGLKICAAHSGGYFPSYAARSDYGCVHFPGSCTPLKKKPTEYLRQLYFDSMVFTSEGLRHLIAECGISQIVMGTDYPFAWSNTAVDHILNTQSLTASDKRAILGENAARLLKI